MKVLDSLSLSQLQVMQNDIDRWLELGYATEPLDRAAATSVLCKLYQSIDERNPIVLFAPPPATCVLALDRLALLASDGSSPKTSDYSSDVEGDLRARFEVMWRSVPVQVLNQVNRELPLWKEIRGRGKIWRELSSQYTDLLDGMRGRVVSSQLADPLWRDIASQFQSRLADRFDKLWRPVSGQLQTMLETYLSWDGFGGNWASDLPALYDFARKIGANYSEIDKKLLKLWIEQNQCCHFWFPCGGVVVASEMPCKLTVDEDGRLHGDSGPAIEYVDGFSVYAWHGVGVDARVIMSPELISMSDIQKEGDPEVRRIMMERSGRLSEP